MSLRADTRTVAVVSALTAVGAAARIVLGRIALESPVTIYGVLIKIGLTETVAFVNGVAFGPIHGFVTGALVIVISDLFMMPGPWTPFIAGIIGVVGSCGGLLKILKWIPSRRAMIGSAILVTFVSEFLQNLWLTLSFGVPLAVAMVSGMNSLIAALVNNLVLFPTVGLRAIQMIRDLITPIKQRPESPKHT